MEMMGLGGVEKEDTKVKGVQERGHKGGIEGRQRWLANGSGYRGSSPLEESKRCMTLCVSDSFLTLFTRGVFKVEANQWEGVQILVDTFVRDSGSLYTLYISAQSSHSDDPLSTSLKFSRMVNESNDVALL